MNSSPVAKNPARLERRLLQNILFILAQSRIYSPLIDVLQIDPYNIRMEENTVQTLVAFEIAQPRKRLSRSAGAVYFMLTALVLAVISAANFAATHWQIPREWVQLPLYVLLIAAGIFVYRRHYVCYRYTLTDQTFAMDRIAGNAERAIAAVDLRDIDWTRADHEGRKTAMRTINASVLPKRESVRLTIRLDDQETVLYISPSEEFYMTLQAQIQRYAERESK
jgi:hypothetical protein